jgi:hypothetical protein
MRALRASYSTSHDTVNHDGTSIRPEVAKGLGDAHSLVMAIDRLKALS